jgi:hypothetical protein
MASPNFCVFCREDCDKDEYVKVSEYADSLISHLRSPEVSDRILRANLKGTSSADIQACLLDHLHELGFHSEREGLFQSHLLRPDYYLELTPNRGILLEVEKGKTLTNNMDILDLWKCHICNHAQYLFLVVPIYAQNAGSRNVFSNVAKRMEPFFRRENYVNVYGMFIFGY